MVLVTTQVKAQGFNAACGDKYQGVCPASLERDFLSAYDSGYQFLTLEWRASNATRQRADKRSELNRIEQGIVSNLRSSAQRTAPAGVMGA